MQGQVGVIALRDFEAGHVFKLCYAGQRTNVVPPTASHVGNKYRYEVPGDKKAVDAAKYCNELSFVNDGRGLVDRNNCEFFPRHGLIFLRVRDRPVRSGEWIWADYGPTYQCFGE